MAVAVGLGGCADEMPRPDYEALQGTVLRIPNVEGMAEMATRAGGSDATLNPLEAECRVNSLYLIAFDAADGAFSKAIDLTAITSLDDGMLGVHDNATLYQLDEMLPEGNYHLYVVANLDDYTDGSYKAPSDEDDLRNLQLNFIDADGRYLLDTYTITSKKAGLPMACLPTEMTLNGNPLTGGTVKISKGEQTLIHADLTYLCAKVGMTLFYDGESYSDFMPSGMFFETHDVQMQNLATGATCVAPGKDYDELNGAFTEKRTLDYLYFIGYLYHDHDRRKPYTEEEVDQILPSFNSFNYKDDFEILWYENEEGVTQQKAWNNIFYVPENLSESTLTSMTLHAEAGTDLKYHLPLLPAADSDCEKTLRRGFAYDLVGKVTGPETIVLSNIQVEPWTVNALYYTLQGNCYLHLDQTSISQLVAGEEYSIWWESSVPANELKFDIPTYQGEGMKEAIPLYIIDVVGDQLKINVNPALRSQFYPTINNILLGESEADLTMSRYLRGFHVVAGPLRKRVDIEALRLKRFLTVDPTDVSIDVRENVASGAYNGEYTVTVKTNIEKFTISPKTWIDTQYFKLYDMDGREISLTDATTITMEDSYNGVYTFKVKYSGLNSGDDFWSALKQQIFTVSVDNTGFSGADIINDVDVTFNIIPSNDDYIIHFQAPSSWTAAHMYAYQCLELPASMPGTHYSGKPFASLPVGYIEGTNHNAALEYSFTGKIAFKGWDEKKNKDELANAARCTYGEGFLYLSGTWAPKGNTDHYFIDFDFYADYRASCGCNDCNNTNYNVLWPGINMQKEGDPKDGYQWWTISLSGLATPGKTLLMWANLHSGNGGRYPGNDQVGVPLFDYPSHEGWFYWDTKAFSPNGPDASSSYNWRKQGNGIIYFDNPAGWNPPYVYWWNSTGNNTWPGVAMEQDSQGRWYAKIDKNAQYLIFSNNGNKTTQTQDILLDNTTNRYTAVGGNPDYITYGGSSSSGVVYRFTWYKDDRTHINLSKDNQENRYENMGDYLGRYYYDVTLDNDNDDIWYRLSKGDGNNIFPAAWTSAKSKRGNKVTGQTYDYLIQIY